MYYFLYGEDTYSIAEKVKAFRTKFGQNTSALFNHICLDGAKLSKSTYLEAAFSLPFLMEKKLIEIRNFLLESSDQNLKKYIADNLAKIPESTVILFIEQGVPDARTVLYKALSKSKTSQRFSLLNSNALKNWINEKTALHRIKISPEARMRMEVLVGPDLWRLENEIKKLAAYVKAVDRNEISTAEVDLLVVSPNQSNIFDFVDFLANKNSRQASLILHNLIETGENEIYILTMIVYQFRNLLSVSSLTAEGVSENKIATVAKLHPFVAKKSLQIAKKYSFDELKKIYQNLYLKDAAIKNGEIPAKLALDLLVAEVCKK